ncbi:MAG: GNAT family N-acetyltransferase [Bacteroidia bacterium]
MKIYHLKHREIDKQKWDLMVAASRNRLPYCFSWFLDIVSPGWEALITADYEYLFPLTGKRKYGVHYLPQPDYTQQLGLFSVYEVTETDVRKFLEAIPAKYRYIDIQFNSANRLLGISDFEVKRRRTHYLDLSPPYGELKKNYAQLRKRNLKKAAKKHVSVEVNADPAMALDFYYSSLGRKLKGVGRKQMALLKKLVAALMARKMCRLYSAHDSLGQLMSISFFIIDRDYCIYLIGSSNEAGRNLGGHTLLFDQLIRDFASTSKILDFEGSEIPSIANFFKSFGSEEILYLQIRANKLPILLRWFKE